MYSLIVTCVTYHRLHRVWVLDINFQQRNTQIGIIRVLHIHNTNLTNSCRFISNRYRTLLYTIVAMVFIPVNFWSKKRYLLNTVEQDIWNDSIHSHITFTAIRGVFIINATSWFPVSVTDEIFCTGTLSAHFKVKNNIILWVVI